MNVVPNIPKLFFAGIASLFICNINIAKAQSINYAVHANIIYHFTKYIDWPADKKSGPFVIGIIGDSPLFEALKSTTSNKMFGKQKIVVEELGSTQSFYSCNIVFISEDESHKIKKIVSTIENEPILVVTEYRGATLKGSCINFIVEDDRLIMEINIKNIEKKKLKIASELKSLGKVVE